MVSDTEVPPRGLLCWLGNMILLKKIPNYQFDHSLSFIKEELELYLQSADIGLRHKYNETKDSAAVSAYSFLAKELKQREGEVLGAVTLECEEQEILDAYALLEERGKIAWKDGQLLLTGDADETE